jgi:hypothetical protein
MATNWHSQQFYGDTNTVVIENCTFDFEQIGDDLMDVYSGCKFCFRYNMITNTAIGWHGADSDARGVRMFEIYKNNFYTKNSYTVSEVALARSGSGVMWSNTADSGYQNLFYLREYRASSDYPDSFSTGGWMYLPSGGSQGPMNGSRIVDGNQDSSGWPGLDQIGRGSFTNNPVTWTSTFTAANYEAFEGVYQWSNKLGANSSPTCIVGGYDNEAIPNVIKLGRDYFDNTAKPGYTPLVYPHPLIGGGVANTNPPAITQQPQNATVLAGAPAIFSVVATGGGTLTYQWAWCGTNVTGATADSWTTPATLLGNSNSVVSVRVGSAYGSVTSSNAYLYVMNGVAPTITTQPTSRTVGTGGSTTFTVTASGTAPLAYQWRFDSGPISGATASSYTIGSAATNNAGSYAVVVTNSFGIVTSAMAVLGVMVSTQTVHYYYVSANGSDSANGSIGSPWATIEYASSNMVGGDVLYIRGGTYGEVWDVYGPSGRNASLPTIIQNYPGETPIFDNTGGANTLNGLNWFVVSGLTIRNYSTAIVMGYGGACSNVTLTNLTVYNTINQGLQIYNNSHDCLLVGSTVYGTGTGTQNGEGLYLGTGGDTAADNTHNITIRSNIFHNTKDEAIELKQGTYSNIVEGNLIYTANKAQDTYGAGGGAVEIDAEGTVNRYSGNPTQIVRGNLIYDTYIGIHMVTGSSAYNNIVYGCSFAGISVDSSDSYVRNVWNNTVASNPGIAVNGGTASVVNNIGYGSGSYNLVTNNAYFVNMAGHDYHLVVGSAPIGAGTNLFSGVATDFDGNARPSSGAFDIGAYQYVAAGGAASPPPPPTNLHVAGQ